MRIEPKVVRYVSGIATALLGSEEFTKEVYTAAKVDPIAQFSKPVASHMNRDHAGDIKLTAQHVTSIMGFGHESWTRYCKTERSIRWWCASRWGSMARWTSVGPRFSRLRISSSWGVVLLVAAAQAAAKMGRPRAGSLSEAAEVFRRWRGRVRMQILISIPIMTLVAALGNTTTKLREQRTTKKILLWAPRGHVTNGNLQPIAKAWRPRQNRVNIDGDHRLDQEVPEEHHLRWRRAGHDSRNLQVEQTSLAPIPTRPCMATFSMGHLWATCPPPSVSFLFGFYK